jgi:hypothetical protein
METSESATDKVAIATTDAETISWSGCNGNKNQNLSEKWLPAAFDAGMLQK